MQDMFGDIPFQIDPYAGITNLKASKKAHIVTSQYNISSLCDAHGKLLRSQCCRENIRTLGQVSMRHPEEPLGHVIKQELPAETAEEML